MRPQLLPHPTNLLANQLLHLRLSPMAIWHLPLKTLLTRVAWAMTCLSDEDKYYIAQPLGNPERFVIVD